MRTTLDIEDDLLDVNLLIALFDGAHLHHLVVHDWFESKGIIS